MFNIVIKEEMLSFGYTENIVINIHFIKVILVREETYMQKTCDVAVKAILAKKNLRKKCVNRDKM